MDGPKKQWMEIMSRSAERYFYTLEFNEITKMPIL